MGLKFPDPLRRCAVPKNLDSVTTIGAVEALPGDVGMADDGVERIWRAAERLYRRGVHPALAVCVRRDGKVVLNRAIGHVRGNGPGEPADSEKVLATPDTPFVLASASKAVTAAVVHLADEQGLLHIGDPVAEYIPEFAANGKGNITIGHVLSHRAGVPNLPREALDLDRVNDRQFILDVMCAARPQWGPGRVVAYHAVSGGFVLAEIIHRVSGMSIRGYLRREVLEPLGMRYGNYGVGKRDLRRVAVNYTTGAPTPPPLSNMFTRILGVGLDEATNALNDPRVQTGIAPSLNVISTAEEHSRLYEMMRAGGVYDGTRIMKTATIRRAIAEQNWFELDLMLGMPVRYSLGFMLGRRIVSLYGPNTDYAFGHLGFTNIVGWADPQRRVAATILSSGKPVLSTHVLDFLSLPGEITRQCPADGLQSSPLHLFE